MPQNSSRGLLPSVKSCQKSLYSVFQWNSALEIPVTLLAMTSVLFRRGFHIAGYLMFEVLSLCRLSAARGDQDLIQVCESLKHWALCPGYHDAQGEYTRPAWPAGSTQLLWTICAPIRLCALRKSPSLSKVWIYLLK